LKNVFVASDNIITSLGFTSEENILALTAERTGIKWHEDDRLYPAGFWASLVDNGILHEKFSAFGKPDAFTRFEKLVTCSVQEALKHTPLDIHNDRTLFILSTTKGNIDILDRKRNSQFEENKCYLRNTADLLHRFFDLQNKPVVISNACISGVLSIIIGSRLIRSGQYDHIVITGADLVTEFVLSGFNSFLSLCSGPCKPFDEQRQGLSLGEGAGTVILTADVRLAGQGKPVLVGPGFSSNDANHISGPSRSGEGLFIAIERTLQAAAGKWQMAGRAIDYISAHGTATPFNDEMESVAITRAGLQHIPVNSYKGYWGHTLGAAGIIESVAGFYSMRRNVLFKTLGYNQQGVSHPIAVIGETREQPVNTFLKIASGFGGCNASLLYYS
jgi:3-oxoacyl-[acyl-carrier-protein] synthase I